MKKLLTFLLFSLSAFATTTVTGHVLTLGTGNVTSGAYVRFWLRGCAGNQPRVSSSGAIAPTQGGVFYFDFPVSSSGQVSGTLYSTRDNAGTGNGDIECGGSFTAVWYGMQVFVGGKGGPEVAVHAKSGAILDIANAFPLTTNPVMTAPAGDVIYLRLDGRNSPVTGSVSFSDSITVQNQGNFGTGSFSALDDTITMAPQSPSAVYQGASNGIPDQYSFWTDSNGTDWPVVCFDQSQSCNFLLPMKFQFSGFADGQPISYNLAAGKFQPPLNVFLNDNMVTAPIGRFGAISGNPNITGTPTFAVGAGLGTGGIGTIKVATVLANLSFAFDAALPQYTGVAGVNVSGAGNGAYTSTCTISAPDISGTNSACTALLAGGNVTGIQITTYGKGYINAPTVTVAGGSGQTFTAVLADECGNIQNAFAAAFAANVRKVDATGFGGSQVCQYDPFKTATGPFELVLGSSRIIASTNLWPPRLPHYVHGIGGAATNSSLGTIIEECGSVSGTGNVSFASSACTVTTPLGAVTIPQFPCLSNCAGGSATTQLTFTTPFHAIYPAGTYTCLYCDGGGNAGTNGGGWNNDAFGNRLEHLKIDGGGNINTFLYYTQNEQERSEVDDINWGHIGAASTTVNSAAFFYDRTEAPSANAGPSHFEMRNTNGNTNSTAGSAVTGAWGIVIEGSNAYCAFSGGGGSGATCFVQKVSSGTPTVVVGYPGTGYGSPPTWKVWGAPASYGGTPIQDCTGTAVLTGNQVSGMGSQCGATDYNNGMSAQGPEGLKATVQGAGSCGSTGCMSGGVLLTGVGNPSVDYLHCEQMQGNACLQIGDGSDYVSSGFFHTIDGTSTVATNLVHILPGADGQQNFYGLQFTSVSGTPNVINDESTISGITGSQKTLTTAQVNAFGSTRNLESYSSGLGLIEAQPLIFQDSLGAISHIQGPTDQALKFASQNNQNISFAPNGTGTNTFSNSISFTKLLDSVTAPTISSGFGASPSIVQSNGTRVFQVNVGTGGVATSGVIGLPTAANGWICQVTDQTTNIVTRQTSSTTSTVTVTAASAWTASDKLNFICAAL